MNGAENLQNQYPNAYIYIVQLPPRRNNFQMKTKRVNNKLVELVPESLHLIKHENLSIKNMFDDKHIKRNDIYLLVNNMKDKLQENMPFPETVFRDDTDEEVEIGNSNGRYEYNNRRVRDNNHRNNDNNRHNSNTNRHNKPSREQQPSQYRRDNNNRRDNHGYDNHRNNKHHNNNRHEHRENLHSDHNNDRRISDNRNRQKENNFNPKNRNA